MTKLGVFLLSCAALMLPAIASAQNATLEICNNGRLDIVIAVAARIQKFITGYKWTTQGWFTAAAGQCTTVYDEEYDAAGPYTPQSGARVAFAVTRSDGVWGAFQSNRVQSGWMRSGTGQLCVNRTDAFTFDEATVDSAANCKGVLVPVAHDFMPDGPGKFTYTMDWDGHGDFVALGKGGQPRRSVANSGASDSVDNSAGGQFLRALAQAARDGSTDAAKKAAPAAAPGHAAVKYFCFSTDPKQPVVYFSNIFDLPDAGDEPDNLMVYVLAKEDFQLYLIDNYKYPDAKDLADCVWTSTATTSNAAVAMAAKKKGMAAQAVAAKKRVVETGWKDTEPQVATDASNSEATKADLEASNPKGKAAMLQWVREDLTAYIEASKTGFDSYKSGEAQLSQGYRMWTSSEKPALARGCWVMQGDTASTFSCVIPVSKETERANYNQLTGDVTASLPGDWSPVAGSPFGGNLPSAGYRSSTGAHGEIWLAETAAGEYELHYQLVSAPTGRQTPKPTDDDPIGRGGFITPPTPQAPPAPPN